MGNSSRKSISPAIVDYSGQNYKEIKEHCIKSETLFEDPKFPKGDIWGGKYDPDIIWKRAKYLSPQTPWFYFEDGASRFHVNQGELGNCWFVATVAGLTLNPELFAKSVPLSGQSFKEKDYAGIFHFCFWQCGQWVDVVVDDYLPTKNGKLVFAHSKDPNEFWPALLEKAYAKLHGSYEGLVCGNAIGAMVDFSGGFNEEYHMADGSADTLFEILMRAYQRSSLMTCSGATLEGQDRGLTSNHYYTITKVVRFSPKVDLLRIRNPWGKDEWKGSWSNYSDEMKSLSSRHRKKLVTDNVSEFFMTKEDFFEYFQEVQIVRLTPESLNDGTFKKSKLVKKEFFGSWQIGSTAGGCGDYNDCKYASTFATNPQFLIKFDGKKNQNCSCIVALMQKGHNGLTSSNIGDFLIGFEIFRVDDPEKTNFPLEQRFCQNNATKAISTGAYINKREVLHAYSDMKPGTYVIIPATSKSNQAGEFLLRIFSDNSLIDAKAVQLYIPPENTTNGISL